MRNLKRALSLALAAIMVLGLMIVGAGAADVYDNFTDKDEIDHAEAVQTMVALNVIAGKEDGSFYDPTGTLTRAEMAKIVSYVMNGGVEPVMAIKPVPTYSDIDGHWAESYIEYCTSMDIIAGDGAGKFNPEGTLTASQTAKMFLTAMGYNANVFGFTGTNWEVNTNRYANEAGLYKELGDVSPSDPISRDDAAQMAYNAIQATMMKRSWSQDLETGKLTETYTPWTVENSNGESVGWTLLNEKFNGAVEIGFLTDYSYDAVKDMWTYDFDDSDFHGAKITANNKIGSKSLRTAEDYTDLFGRQVKVIYNVEDTDVVYGVYPYNSSVIAEGFSGDVTADNVPATRATEIKIDGTTYKLDTRADATDLIYHQTGTQVPTNGTLDKMDQITDNYAYQMIDNDGDNKVDVVILLPFTVAKVTYVGKDSVTFAMQNGDVDAAVSGNQKLDDIVVYDGIAKDDYVMCVNAAYADQEAATYTKLDTVSGTISGVKGSEYKIDGEWYTNKTSTTLNANDTIDYIALGSVIYYAKVTSGATGTEAVALVYNIADKSQSGVSSGYIEAGVILADGSKKTAEVVEINGVDVSAKKVNNSITGTDASGAAPSSFAINTLMGSLVKYEFNSDGELTLWTIPDNYSAAKIMGFDGTLNKAKNFDNSTDQVDGKELADDAVVFVWNSAKKEAKVYTGKELKNTSHTTFGQTNGTFASGLYGKENGFTYAQVVVLQNTSYPTITTGANYGYLVADAYTSKEDGTNYRYYTYWDGTQNVEAKEKDKSDISALKAGTVITFDVVSEGVIKNVSPANVKMGAVTGWDGDSKIEIRGDASNNNKVTSETVILYVDSEKQEGVPGGEISEAVDQDGNGTVEDNVLYIVGGDRTYALLVVDVNQEMHSDATVVLTSPASTAAINTALQSNNVEISDSTVTLDGALTIPDGRTLTVKTLGAGTNNVTVSDNASLIVKNGITGSGTVTVKNNSTLNVTGNVAGAITSQGSVTISGTAADITATKGTIDVKGKTTGVVTLSNDAEMTAGEIDGNITMTGTATLTATKFDWTDTISTTTGNAVTLTGSDTISGTGIKKLTGKWSIKAAVTLTSSDKWTVDANSSVDFKGGITFNDADTLLPTGTTSKFSVGAAATTNVSEATICKNDGSSTLQSKDINGASFTGTASTKWAADKDLASWA